MTGDPSGVDMLLRGGNDASNINVGAEFDLRSNKYGYFVGVSGSYNCYLGNSSNSYNTNIYSGYDINLAPNRYIFVNDSVYNHTSSSSANMRLGSGQDILRSTASSKRWKHDIVDVSNTELNPEKLYDVVVRQFKFNDDYLDKDDERYNKDVIGFIAEELNEVYPIAVSHSKNEDGSVNCDDWDLRYMVPAMLKLIQDQNLRIKKLEEN
jgi:hypothetical protein